MINLDGKVAIVTGATSGIGKAIAIELLNQNCHVVITGRDSEKIKESILNQHKFKKLVTYIPADLQNDQGLNFLVTQVSKVFRKIDIIIHSAGLIYLGDTLLTEVEKLDEQFRINVRAPYYLTQAFLNNIIKNKGQIVFINSTAGLDSWGGVGQYAATKHALRAWANSLRDEVIHHGVKIINIFPGATHSPMQKYVQQFDNSIYEKEKYLKPENVAAVVINALKASDLSVLYDIIVKPNIIDDK